MFKKLVALLLCAWAFSCGPAPAYAQDLLSMRDKTVMVTDGDGMGSGVVIGPNLVLTAAHVVGDSDNVTVEFYQGTMGIIGKVVKKDKLQDWALIKVNTGVVLKATINCDVPGYGQHISMIGMPMGLPWLVMQGNVAQPVILYENRFVYLDININHGNSGGPVFDDDGSVIGIAVAALSPQDGEGVTIGLMSPLFKFCNELLNTKGN